MKQTKDLKEPKITAFFARKQKSDDDTLQKQQGRRDPPTSSLNMEQVAEEYVCGTQLSAATLSLVTTSFSQTMLVLVILETRCPTFVMMSISIRYVDFESHPHSVREDFIKFVKVIDLTGKWLSNTIVGVLEELGLSLDNLRSQRYDSGSNMSGAFKGTQSYVRVLQPLAIYVHCYNHCLNLLLVKACGCQVQAVRNMIGIVEETTNFAGDSPECLQLLKKKIQDHCPDVTGDTLFNKTRWVELHEAFLRFKDLLPAVISFLEKTMQQITGEARLCYSIINFQFIFALDVVAHVMKCTLPLSRLLQSPKLNIGQAEDLAQTTVLAIENQHRMELLQFLNSCMEVQGLTSVFQSPLEFLELAMEKWALTGEHG
ncbi:hypothetical protein PR048_028297 [Dryococelus australis]|uniref:DUF4371 domain-containing protein n=1 Tax=Dryococelus australis TaxID=614101 RepID=A0ABQ9GIU7_9NEOP|nr:hypothetical protein PR048_028297 [Dryococelus australis]